MIAKSATLPSTTTNGYPHDTVVRRLREELEEAAAESAVLRGDWEPLLDSLRMVSAIARIEDLFPFRMPPEKLVKRGGYKTVDEGVEGMSDRVRRLWNDRQKREVRV